MYNKVVNFFLLLFMVILLSGCANENLDESPLPWATPAGWEGQLPGFGAGSSN